MLRWSISYESHELLDVFVVRSTQFSSSIHFPLVNFTFCELPPIAIKTSPPLTTGPPQPSPVLPTALCRLNSTIQIFLQKGLFLRQKWWKIFCLFVSFWVQSPRPFGSFYYWAARCSCSLCDVPAALYWLSNTIHFFFIFFLETKLYIPSGIKTQMNLVPFCFWADSQCQIWLLLFPYFHQNMM